MNRVSINIKRFIAANKNGIQSHSSQFETVYSLPSIKYFAMLNRLKVYQLFGTCIAVPTAGLLETLSIIPEYSFLTTTYIGATGIAVLSLASLPFQNIIGHLYISEDNKQIKISSLNFWGKRNDRVISVDEWIPLLNMKSNIMDAMYLSPQLTDGTKYKLFIKFGKVQNSKKMGQVLE